MTANFIPKVRHASNETISSKIQRGDNLLKAKCFHEALALFAKIIETDPDVTKAYLYAGQSALGLKRYDEALSYANKASRLNPMEPKAALLAAKVHVEQSDWTEAKAHFQNAIDLDSRSAVGYAGMGEIAAHHKKYDEAIALFRKALALDPNYTKAYTSIAKLYMAKQDEASGFIKLEEDLLDFIERSYHIGVVEEDKLWQVVGSSSLAELEEQLTDLEYVLAWLSPLLEEIQWQVDFLKKACGPSRKTILPAGIESGFD